MTHLGSTAEWVDLLDSRYTSPRPRCRNVGQTAASRGERTGGSGHQPLVLGAATLPRSPEYRFRIQPQAVILEPDSGDELRGRLDIAFLPFVPSDEVYFCLECKRINVRTANGIRPYFVEYVRFGMLRFVRWPVCPCGSPRRYAGVRSER